MEPFDFFPISDATVFCQAYCQAAGPRNMLDARTWVTFVIKIVLGWSLSLKQAHFTLPPYSAREALSPPWRRLEGSMCCSERLTQQVQPACRGDNHTG